MAVRFNFVMLDIDAENLVDCVHECICRTHIKIMDEMVKKKPRDKAIEMHRKYIKYLEGLKEVMCKGSSRAAEKKGKKR